MMIATLHPVAPVLTRTAALLLSGLLLCSTGAGAATSGKVVIAKGEVLATLASERRTLQRGAPLLEGDVVTTGAASRTQMRFIDSALLTLEAQSELTIAEYAYQDAGGRPDSVVMRLSRGAFRTITGAVGKQNSDAYRVETPLASMGIRGTSYLVRLTGSGEDMVLEVIVLEGVVVITTPKGTIRIGAGEAYQAARVQSDGSIEALRIDDPTLRVDAGGNPGSTGFGSGGLLDDVYAPVGSGAGDAAINPAENTGEASSQGASDFESGVQGGQGGGGSP